MSQRTEWSAEDWKQPPSIYRGAPFWAWNDRLDPDRLSRQIGQMHGAGMGGFFMHSRYGLKTAYLSGEWFDCVSACVERARSLGMKAYLYDEDRWPSGAAGGTVTRDRPEYARQLLVAAGGGTFPEPLERLGTFAVRFDEAGRLVDYHPVDDERGAAEGETVVGFVTGVSEPSGWFNEAAYLDVLNPEAVAEFIRVTHQAYADRYAELFGTIIPAVFTDEPNYSHGRLPVGGGFAAVPWTGALPREFRKRRGYDLRDHLPELVYPVGDRPDSGFSRVRHDFWLTLTEMFVESFSAQVGRWCRKRNIALTGHYLAEETLYSQIGAIGSAMPHYAHMQWPGIDILTDQRHEIGTVKQCTSVADQLGRQRVLSELYGCTGWDWQLEGHKFNGGWQYVLGVNFRCPHLSLYSLAGGAKRDYPASIFPHSPWWKYYRVVEDYFARLGLVLTAGTPVRDVLVINPIESAFGLYLPGRPDSVSEIQGPFEALLVGLLDGHYDYDLGDESLMVSAKVAAGALKVGRMTYRVVVVPPSITLRSTTVGLLKRFAAAGGSLVFAGRAPERVDGEPSEALSELIDRSTRCHGDPPSAIACLGSLLDRRVSITEGGVELPGAWSMLRHVKGGQVLFVQSTDRAGDHEVRVSVAGHRPVVLMDPATGERRRLEADLIGSRVEFDLSLPPTGSALVSLGLRAGDARRPRRRLRVASSIEVPGPYPVELLEPNTFPLDTCRYQVGTDAVSDPMPVLLAEEQIRQRFGLPDRKARGCQPWYLTQTGRADQTPRGRCRMQFAFHVSKMPERLQAAVERPGDFEISLNGRPVSSAPTGWWVDEDLELVDLTSAVRVGGNELVLSFDYRSDMELEDLHLVGRFGVRQTGPRRTFDAYTLTAPPEEMPAGDWIGNGLDFYTGSVKYELTAPDAIWPAISEGHRIRLSLPAVRCSCAAIHVGEEALVLPWPPMAVDITNALLTCGRDPCNVVYVEVIGGRRNILGPLHVPWKAWTGPGEFDPHNPDWTDEYLLTDHGLTAPPVFEILA